MDTRSAKNAMLMAQWALVALFGPLALAKIIDRSNLSVVAAFAAIGVVAQIGSLLPKSSGRLGQNLLRGAFLADGIVALAVSLDGRPGGEGIWPIAILALLAESVIYRQWRVLWAAGVGYLIVPTTAYLQNPRSSAHATETVVALLAGTAVAHILGGLKGRDDRLDVGERRLGAVVESVSSLANSPDLATMLATSLKVALRESSGTAGYVLLTDETDPESLYAEVAIGDEEFHFPRTLGVGEGLSGYVVQMRQLVAVDNREGHGECDGIELGSRAAVSLPLLARAYQGSTTAAADQVVGALTLIGPNGRSEFDEANLQVLQSVSSMMAVAVANARMEARQRTTFLRTLESLATALEARDEYTRGHSQRVCEVSMMLGEMLGFTPEALEELRVGTILHDIGKIGVRDTILNKDGRLTDEEFAVMKSHPVIGYEICKPLMLSEGVLMIIRNHHEKLDGSGYPDGLKGGELPPPLRIVCVADAFDAMSSRRPYRNVMAIEKVVSELSKGAGVQFDPVIVEALKELIVSDRLHELYRQYWEPEERVAA
jgi:putative nucleotidyltransferase with HDIG domain